MVRRPPGNTRARTARNKLIWRKAAVLGGIWAASEIVLGSFLHNVRAPFSGELLTGVGIAIMVAGHRLWPERGLLWRSGLICAAMKSVSPSAVIFGPMAAIAMEGFLAETGVRLLGANPAGYLLAGGLGMSWNLAHKAANLYIVYGPDTVSIYLKGAEWIRSRFGLGSGNLLAPLIFLFAAHFLAGAAAAAAGMKAGKERASSIPSAGLRWREPGGGHETAALRYSAPALVSHLVFILTLMSAGRRIPAACLSGLAVIYAFICARYYPRARAMLARAGVWAGVLAASLVSGLVLGDLSAGLYMALRAFMLMLGFAAIGCELMNPSVRGLLVRLWGGAFFETLECAFGGLPGIISGLPSGRDFARRPLAAIGRVVARAPYLLENIARSPVFIITGAHGGGKSEFAAGLAGRLRAAGGRPGGICAAGLWENDMRAGFDLIDLVSEERVPLCRRGAAGASVTAGEFGFFPEGLAAGAAALSAERLAGTDVVFIDEIGCLELEGGGWAAALDRLLQDSDRPLVLVVRDYLVKEVRARWKLDRAVIWRAGEIPAETAAGELLK